MASCATIAWADTMFASATIARVAGFATVHITPCCTEVTFSTLTLQQFALSQLKMFKLHLLLRPNLQNAWSLIGMFVNKPWSNFNIFISSIHSAHIAGNSNSHSFIIDLFSDLNTHRSRLWNIIYIGKSQQAARLCKKALYGGCLWSWWEKDFPNKRYREPWTAL